jgi:tRNA(Ile)-lysidine synthase
MKEKLLRAIEENGLIEKGDTVLAAFSGGADSTALLFALSGIRENLGFELIAAHYNHGIRQEADADESFCRETAEMLGLRFFSEKGDVPVFAKENGLSLETAARLLH